MRPEPRIKTLTFPRLKLTYNDIIEIFTIFERSFEFRKPFSTNEKPGQIYEFTMREIDAYLRYDAPLKDSNSNRIEWRTELYKTIDDAKKENKKIVYARIECIQRLNLCRYGMHEPIAILELSQDTACLTVIDLNDELVDDVTESLDLLTNKLKEFLSEKERLLTKLFFWNDSIVAIACAFLIFKITSGQDLNNFQYTLFESGGVLIAFIIYLFVYNKLMRQDERVVFLRKWYEI